MRATRKLARRTRREARRERGSRWLWLFGCCADVRCNRYGRRPDAYCLAERHRFMRHVTGATEEFVQREEREHA